MTGGAPILFNAHGRAESRWIYHCWWSAPLLLIVTGALGGVILNLPLSLSPGHSAVRHRLDLAFISFGALTGTGGYGAMLPGSDLSLLGQGVVLILMQLGAWLGMLAGTWVGLFVLGQWYSQLDLPARLWFGNTQDDVSNHWVRSVVLVVVGSLLLEFLGAVGCWPLTDPQADVLTRIWQSLFLSVSAFSNTGYTIGARPPALGHPATVTVLAWLVLLGQIGLPVWINLLVVVQSRSSRRPLSPGLKRLSLQTRLTWLSWSWLFVGGTTVLWFLQRSQSLLQNGSDRTWSGDLLEAGLLVLFRTTGFFNVDLDACSIAGHPVLLLLIWIGGGVGSTAGGVGLLTVAVVLISVVSSLRDDRPLEALGRQLPGRCARLALMLVCWSLLWIGLATFCLALSEPYQLFWLLCQSISAVSNSGLGLTGWTGQLTGFGQVVMIACMVAGKAGPWLLFGMIRRQCSTDRLLYPSQDPTLG